LSDTTKVGVSYRSKIKHDLRGDLTSTGGISNKVSASAEVELPDTFILSVAQTLDDRWEMLGDISWTGWSSIPAVNIVPAAGATQVLDTRFRDTWRYALGANYRYNDRIKLKFGIAYDQSPVPDATHRLVSLPDSNRTWFTTGAQLRLDKTSTVDVGAAYIHVAESHIDATPTALQGNVKGVYDARIWILGAQYSLAF
jgi:long-chain fatty acid transport protein